MKIFATADLHWPSCKEKLPSLVDRLMDSNANVLVLAGDISSFDMVDYDDCLSHFDRFQGAKLAVAGNHDLWTRNTSSMLRYREVLPDMLKKHRFHYLDAKPIIIEDIGFVGNMGWYDYSFRFQEETNGGVIIEDKLVKLKDLPTEIYADKRFRLFDGKTKSYECWADGDYIILPRSDESYADLLSQKLEFDISQVRDKARKLVAVTHHVPFANMVRINGRDVSNIWCAYSGSEKTGRVLLAEPKVTTLISGHTHRYELKQNGHIACYNVSGDYGKPYSREIEV